MPRVRVHPQSQAVFASPITGTNGTGLISAVQIPRVQSVSASLDLAGARRNVQELGSVSPISRPIVSSDISVELSLSYFLLDGFAESLMGLRVLTGTENTGTNPFDSCIKHILASEPRAVRNYYVLTTAEGTDAKGNATVAANNVNVNSTIGIGNGFLSSYSVSAAVGDIPTVQVSIQGDNWVTAKSSTGVPNPAIDSLNSTSLGGQVNLPTPTTGFAATDILRPGDIDLSIGGGDMPMGGADLTTAHIQSFQLQLPLSRDTIQRIGDNSPYARPLQVPVPVTFSISALTSEIDSGSLNSLMTGCTADVGRTVAIGIGRRCNTGTKSIYFELRNVLLDSYSFSAGVDNNNETFDAQFSAMVSGPEDTLNGLFISGSNTGVVPTT
jgi:hypothetical protein